MLNVEIISNGKKIIVSENFITFDDQACELKFNLNDETLIISLVFEIDKKIDGAKVKFETVEKILIVTFKNFDAAFGRGNVEPVEIGTNQGKKLFMNCWIIKPSKQTNYRLVNITIYQEVD